MKIAAVTEGESVDLVSLAQEYQALVSERDRIVNRIEEIRVAIGGTFGFHKTPKTDHGTGSSRLVQIVERLGRVSTDDVERELGCTKGSARQLLYWSAKHGYVHRIGRGLYGPVSANGVRP